MTIPFFRDGFALPVAQALLVLLDQEIAKTELNLERLTQLTFNFRNRHSAPDLGINLPIALTQYLQNDLLVSC